MSIDTIKPIQRGNIPTEIANARRDIVYAPHTNAINDKKIIRGSIVKVGGIEDGFEIQDPSYHDGLWYNIELKTYSYGPSKKFTVSVGAAESFSHIMNTYGSPALLEGRQVIIEYYGDGLESIAKGKAFIVSDNYEGSFANLDVHSPYSIGSMNGGTVDNASLRIKAYMGSAKSIK